MTKNYEEEFRGKDISVFLEQNGRLDAVVQQIYLSVRKGGCSAIIGESGCGKSVFCKTVAGMLSEAKWKVQGEIILNEIQVPIEDDRKMDAFRGHRISMIIQDPLSAFDPRMTIGAHFTEGCPKKEKKERIEQAAEQLQQMNMGDTSQVLKSYPFQLSGGMLQRVLIALSLINRPELLIADEPTTALDATVASEILQLLKKQQKEKGVSILLVSHDIDVVSYMADKIYVMYAGEILEEGKMKIVQSKQFHPYTAGLFRSHPSFSKEKLQTMPGRAPRLGEYMGSGCAFALRCPLCKDLCLQKKPELLEVEDGHRVRCWYWG